MVGAFDWGELLTPIGTSAKDTGPVLAHNAMIRGMVDFVELDGLISEQGSLGEVSPYAARTLVALLSNGLFQNYEAMYSPLNLLRMSCNHGIIWCSVTNAEQDLCQLTHEIIVRHSCIYLRHIEYAPDDELESLLYLVSGIAGVESSVIPTLLEKRENAVGRRAELLDVAIEDAFHFKREQEVDPTPCLNFDMKANESPPGWKMTAYGYFPQELRFVPSKVRPRCGFGHLHRVLQMTAQVEPSVVPRLQAEWERATGERAELLADSLKEARLAVREQHFGDPWDCYDFSLTESDT
ncbi:hypothetical protein LX16_3065 [Stackebrandtia albiflava]|uniref:Uncharacterized protein n=2 Tax=Stackebrandtia albiflava TaxID=406432 RepID=A0A562V329_9ACTN|nr:hypothetical protein LX16_3065 [Stackebrandtia albiflava]